MTNRYHSLSDCRFGPSALLWQARCLSWALRNGLSHGVTSKQQLWGRGVRSEQHLAPAVAAFPPPPHAHSHTAHDVQLQLSNRIHSAWTLVEVLETPHSGSCLCGRGPRVRSHVDDAVRASSKMLFFHSLNLQTRVGGQFGLLSRSCMF